MIKKLIFLISVMMILYSCISQKNVDSKKVTSSKLFKPDSVVISHIGDTIVNIIYNPDSVKLYTLNSITKPDSNDKLLENFIIVHEIGNVADNYYSILQFLIKDQVNYVINDTLKKECRFTPNVAFQFFSKNEMAIVYISFDCDMWGFYYNKNLVIEDFRIRKLLVNYLKPALIDDKYIYSLKK